MLESNRCKMRHRMTQILDVCLRGKNPVPPQPLLRLRLQSKSQVCGTQETADGLTNCLRHLGVMTEEAVSFAIVCAE